MTVKELIEHLRKCDPNKQVLIDLVASPVDLISVKECEKHVYLETF